MKKKIKKIIKDNYKIVPSFILGCILTATGVYAATTIAASNVTYSTTNSGLSSTTLQGAIDELAKKAGSGSSSTSNANIMKAYRYSESGSNICISGNESTCQQITCYRSDSSDVCQTGTIIDYKINSTTTERFHVIRDTGSSLIMQTQRNIKNNTEWAYDYQSASDSSSPHVATNLKGPHAALNDLQDATTSWTNVNQQTFTLGTTTFLTNKYTGCTSTGCSTNKYTMTSRTIRARMITMQEVISLGCTSSQGSCPLWLSNYLSTSASNTGSSSGSDSSSAGIADTTANSSYWTISADSSNNTNAWVVQGNGRVYSTSSDYAIQGIRAVVEVST